jgi:S-adenosyl methyltransferase
MPGDDVPQLDTGHAHPARVYNYWLGGTDNFAADREAAEQAIASNPGILTDVRANRAFLARVARYLAGECGVRQFLDIGTGLPVAGNTHEVAQEVAPDARIVYADNDPIVLRHAGADHPASDIRAAQMAEMTRRVNERMSGPQATMRDHAAITVL